jgi:xanthine/uracil/vitamin C permease (AzgA family)
MDVEDDLKNAKIEIKEIDEEEELRKLKRKKIFIAILGIFMAVLVITYLVPGSYVLSILEGQVTSYKLNSDLTIDLKNGDKIIFDNSTYEQLKQMYFAEQRSEFKACLEGYKENSNYLVTGLYVPETLSQSFSHVTANLCNNSTIISLHTHPYMHCIFSYQDIQGLDAVRKVNPDAIIGLMCETNRFNFVY